MLTVTLYQPTQLDLVICKGSSQVCAHVCVRAGQHRRHARVYAAEPSEAPELRSGIVRSPPGDTRDDAEAGKPCLVSLHTGPLFLLPMHR